MGKHVLCEKPISLTLEGYLSIVKAKALTNLVVMPVHNYAFTPCLENAKKVIQNREIGEIKNIELNFSNNLRSYGAKTDYRLEDSYNIVHDILPHALSVIHALSDPVTKVIEAEAFRKHYNVYDNLRFLAETESGVMINGELNWTSLIPCFKIQALGEKEKIKMDLMKAPYRMVVEYNNKRKIVDKKGIRQYLDLIRLKHPAFINQYKHFVSVIENQTKSRFSIEDEIIMHKVMNKIVSLLSKNNLANLRKDDIER
jgi:predicted dehydrogenase